MKLETLLEKCYKSDEEPFYTALPWYMFAAGTLCVTSEEDIDGYDSKHIAFELEETGTNAFSHVKGVKKELGLKEKYYVSKLYCKHKNPDCAYWGTAQRIIAEVETPSE